MSLGTAATGPNGGLDAVPCSLGSPFPPSHPDCCPPPSAGAPSEKTCGPPPRGSLTSYYRARGTREKVGEMFGWRGASQGPPMLGVHDSGLPSAQGQFHFGRISRLLGAGWRDGSLGCHLPSHTFGGSGWKVTHALLHRAGTGARACCRAGLWPGGLSFGTDSGTVWPGCHLPLRWPLVSSPLGLEGGGGREPEAPEMRPVGRQKAPAPPGGRMARGTRPPPAPESPARCLAPRRGH